MPPFSGVTKSGRVWRRVPESGARSVGRGWGRWWRERAWTWRHVIKNDRTRGNGGSIKGHQHTPKHSSNHIKVNWTHLRDGHRESGLTRPLPMIAPVTCGLHVIISPPTENSHWLTSLSQQQRLTYSSCFVFKTTSTNAAGGTLNDALYFLTTRLCSAY